MALVGYKEDIEEAQRRNWLVQEHRPLWQDKEVIRRIVRQVRLLPHRYGVDREDLRIVLDLALDPKEHPRDIDSLTQNLLPE